MIVKSNSRLDKSKLDAQLDEALEGTFPASDPPAMIEPRTAEPTAPKRAKRPSAAKAGGAPS
jgi:hypothetical protein